MKNSNETGVTLLELLVGVSIFLIVVGAALQVFGFSLFFQRQALGSRELVDQMSLTTELMSRALREAQKEDGIIGCLSEPGANYEVGTMGSSGIRFIDRKSGLCREFFLAEETDAAGTYGVLREDPDVVGGAADIDLTPNDMDVQAFAVDLEGEEQDDTVQPRATFFIEVEARGRTGEGHPRLELQTTISQRRFDIQDEL